MAIAARWKRTLPVPEKLEPRWFTRDEFHKMAGAGVFEDDERLELVDGMVVKMSPQGPRHTSATQRTARQLRRAFGETDFNIREEKPLALTSPHLERYPDVAVARGGDAVYNRRAPRPGDIVLLVEVSDTTLGSDLTTKKLLYGREGIPAYWVLDINGRQLFGFRRPDTVSGEYAEEFTADEAGSVTIEDAPQGPATVAVAALLPLPAEEEEDDGEALPSEWGRNPGLPPQGANA